MRDSNVRVSYITEYITSYEAKIKALNKNGLFDSARLFELFAIEICKLWFKQDFYNLNNENINYPYVDLVSKDKTIFVQVSTQQNLANKIKTTLKNINENKSEKIAKIKSVYFFVLNNDCVDKVVDYSGDEKIGNIEFKKSEHLITTQDVVKKAASDLEFQKALYELLQKEDSKIVEISNKFLKEIKNSKEIGLKSIDCLINDEYEIDRTEIIEKIKNADNRFISVRGEAGSGKSVICKKVIENEEYLLFARAERFVEESNINDIWHFNIQDAFEYLSGKTLTIFIDSLEFIADAPKTKLDTLQSLYELAKDYKNVKIITSCRSCDENAFIKIDSKYYIKTFLVDNLSAIELSKISRKYPIINAFVNDFKYVDLVRSPFYVNLIVKNITDASNISDENKLRDFIWENVICLREKSKQYGVLFNDVVKEVKKIVFDRSKLFLLGINKDVLNQKALHALLSEGVLIDNGNIVRLKYDIFEDICFEKEIDNIFSECRGDYNGLFCKIEEFGRCCYRRYQIWISNKLFTKTNRDKFLYELISTSNLQPKWFTQTIIGIVKSRFGSQFFEEQTNNIITQDLLQKFVDITNLYAFDAKVIFLKNGQRMILQPKGYGRIGLIKIIYKNKLYETDAINVNSVIKLCSDYASSSNLYDEVSSMACLILESYINKELENNNKAYNVYKKINSLLEPIYLMSNYAYEWINSFWDTQISNFLGSDHNSRRLAEEIIEHTLKLTPNSLAKTHAKELCHLAETFWTAELENSRLFYGSRYDGVSYSYGLNKYADSYEHSRDTLTTYNFFNNLLEQNFWVALNWMINFINNATLSCLERKEVDVKKITLRFVINNEEKDYYANQQMWLSGSQECNFPALLGDMVYTLKKQIISIINTAIKFNINYREIASKIKEAILQNSNNIILFSIIEDVGIHFEKQIPGFALDLATSMDIIYWDINRYASLNPTSEAKMLRNNIFVAMGMPTIKDKYEDGSEMKYKCADKDLILQLYNKTNHEIIFGRRGTGKTTLFKSLHHYANCGLDKKSICRCIYIDMEDVVPNEETLQDVDDSIIVIETYRKLLLKFTEFLLDFYAEIYNTGAYYEISYTQEELKELDKKLSIFADLIVYGKKSVSKTNYTEDTQKIVEQTKDSNISAKINFNFDECNSKGLLSFLKSKKRTEIQKVHVQNEFEYILDIDSLKTLIEQIVNLFKIDRLILCIDEFTRVDKGTKDTIQPNIAQLIKDTFFRISNVSVKITSLWHKTEIQKRRLTGNRIGIELGEDIERSIDLDTMFFNDKYNRDFFENMLLNTCILFGEDEEKQIQGNSKNGLKQYIVESLFSSDEIFQLLICGSQGIPRVFGNLIIAAINKRRQLKKDKIDADIVYDCITQNFKQHTRRKLPYMDESIIDKFDEFIDEHKSRFILISNNEYKNHKIEIDGLIENNYMHQYPSENVDRKLRNKYKVYLVHFGNYLEVLDMKTWRKQVKKDGINLYPMLPIEMIKCPQMYEICF